MISTTMSINAETTIKYFSFSSQLLSDPAAFVSRREEEEGKRAPVSYKMKRLGTLKT